MDSRKKAADRHLIGEQPGMRILLTGLVLAFFIGHVFSSVFSPARITTQLEKAASHIHKDVKVSFDSAQLMLGEGILPRFSIVIKNIRMESSQLCWMAPRLEIDELRMPLSTWGLITGRAPVESIEANILTLTVREKYQNCGDQSAAKNPHAVAAQSAVQPLVSLSRTDQEEKYRNDVRSVSVKEFNIVAEKYPQYASKLLDFSVNVKSFEPRVIEVRARTHLLKDTKAGDYLSHANLYAEYKESPEQTIQAHFFGNWREGHYSLIANYFLGDRRLSVESDLKHIPLSQVLSLMQKYDLASKDLNGKQVWLSAKSRWAGSIDHLADAPLGIRDLRMEGDLGDLLVEQVEFTKLHPLEYKPIRVDVRRLDVEKLMYFFNRPHVPGTLGALGQFTGIADIVSDQNITLRGEHKGLEFVFSNKGQRELQVLERILGTVSLRGDHWNISVDRVEPRGGTFLGSLKVNANRDFESIDVKARVDELILVNSVQKLMTGDGEIGTLSVDGDVQMNKGRVQKAKGLVRLQNLTAEGLELTKSKAQFEGQRGDLDIQLVSQKVRVGKASPAAQVLSQVLPENYWPEGQLSLSDFSGKFHLHERSNLDWKNVSAKLVKNTMLMTEGGWDQNGSLKGSVSLREGRSTQKWSVQGHRDEPRLSRDANPRGQK